MDKSLSDAMRCPHCKSDVELTWSRYFRLNPFRLTCPSCGLRLKVRWPRSYFFVTPLYLAVTTFLFSAVADLYFRTIDPIVTGGLFAMSTGFVIDRWIEQRLMKLKIDTPADCGALED